MFDDHEDDYAYDVAQICLNGHVVNTHAEKFPGFNSDHCGQCGAKTTTKCLECGGNIQGQAKKVSGYLDTPAFCSNCGVMFPWTRARIAAAKAMADEVDGLTDTQRISLKASIDDIAGDNPMTEVAVTRVKKLIAGVPRAAGEMIRKLVVDIASETAVKMMKGQ